MPSRKIVAKELSELFKSLAHPHRLQIIEEIGARELDVNSLQEILEINHSNVSQHLAVLRAHRVVVERREGRSVFYRLRHPEMAAWLLESLNFLTEDHARVEQMREAFDHARAAWTIRANGQQETSNV